MLRKPASKRSTAMFEKGVKSLTWKAGFVSSIDGVETKNLSSNITQCKADFRTSKHSSTTTKSSHTTQYHTASPISKIPGLNPDSDSYKQKIPKSLRYQRETTTLQFQQSNTLKMPSSEKVQQKSINHNDRCGNKAKSIVSQNQKSLKERQTEQQFCDKENQQSITRLNHENIKAWHEPEQEIPLIEQLIRKRSGSNKRSIAPVCRPDIVPVDQKGKIYFLINRNDGMITHIIKASPKQG